MAVDPLVAGFQDDANEWKARAEKAEAERDEQQERADTLVGKVYEAEAEVARLRELRHKDRQAVRHYRNERDRLREGLREVIAAGWEDPFSAAKIAQDLLSDDTDD